MAPRSSETCVGRFDIGGGVDQEDGHTVVVGSLAAAHVDTEGDVAAAGSGAKVEVAIGACIHNGAHVGTAGCTAVSGDVDGVLSVSVGCGAAIPVNAGVAGGLPGSPLCGVLEVVENGDGVGNLSGGEGSFVQRDAAKGTVRAVGADAEVVGRGRSEASDGGRVGEDVGVGGSGGAHGTVGNLPMVGTDSVRPSKRCRGGRGGDYSHVVWTRAGGELSKGHVVDVGIACGGGAVLAEGGIGAVASVVGKRYVVLLIGGTHGDGLYGDEGALIFGVGHHTEGDTVIVSGGTSAFAPENDFEGVGRVGKGVDLRQHGQGIVAIGGCCSGHVEVEVVVAAVRVGGAGVDVGEVTIGGAVVDAVPADGEA